MKLQELKRYLDREKGEGIIKIGLKSGVSIFGLRSSVQLNEDGTVLIFDIFISEDEMRSEEIDVETIEKVYPFLHLRRIGWMLQAGIIRDTNDWLALQAVARLGCRHHDD